MHLKCTLICIKCMLPINNVANKTRIYYKWSENKNAFYIQEGNFKEQCLKVLKLTFLCIRNDIMHCENTDVLLYTS